MVRSARPHGGAVPGRPTPQPPMNLHRLEVLFHVVENRGIKPAARRVPWRISASAISKCMSSLEQEYGMPFFIRDPFELLPAGQRYYDAYKKFYEEIQRVARETAGLNGALLRIGASPYVLKEYMLPLLGLLRRRHPDLQLQIRAGTRHATENALAREEIDIAVLTVDEPPEGSPWQPLLEPPVMLFVPESSPAQDAWACLAARPRLVTPPSTEAVTRCFGTALQRRNLHCDVAIESSETGEVPFHVQAGGCVGVSVGVGALTTLPGIRALPLAGVGSVTVGAVWRKSYPELQTLLGLAVASAKAVMKLKDGAADERPLAVDTGAKGYVAVGPKMRPAPTRR